MMVPLIPTAIIVGCVFIMKTLIGAAKDAPWPVGKAKEEPKPTTHVFTVDEYRYELNLKSRAFYKLATMDDYDLPFTMRTPLCSCPLTVYRVLSCTMIHKNRIEYVVEAKYAEGQLTKLWYYPKANKWTYKVADEMKMEAPTPPAPETKPIQARVDITPVHSKQKHLHIHSEVPSAVKDEE